MENVKQREKTRKLLLMHCQTYPQLDIQDIFKFLYHSSFGCEHLVSSFKTAVEYISKEYAAVCRKEEQSVETLDGDYSRVPLSYLKRGLSASTFGKLFVASAKEEKNGLKDLLHKIEVAKELAEEGLLPFSQAEFEEAAAVWEVKGYPAIHHSSRFRETYQPSYRVIANRYIPFLPLFAEIDKRLEEGKAIVAIEGGSASGKTTLSRLLEDIYECTVFHMDDFFLQPGQRTTERFAEVGGNIDRERFLAEVLQPLSKGNPIHFRRFDCSTMSLTEEITVFPRKLVIVEGAYSMHPDLAEYYDLSVFLDIPAKIQKERILHRNSPQMAQRFFSEWIPLENTYFEKLNIRERCGMVIPVSD